MTIALVPRPRSLVELHEVGVELDANTSIMSVRELREAAEVLGELLRPATGFAFPLREHGAIEFLLDSDPTADPEAYELTARRGRVRIVAADRRGALNAVQTLRQLLPSEIFAGTPRSGARWVVAAVRIEDAPSFAWRGAHLDVARHMMPVDFVHRFIDLLAMHKLNRLHLHLTDDQGWRFEVSRHPLLTQVGGWRRGTAVGVHSPPWSDDGPHDGNRHGGFYTRTEMAEIVEHARRLGIEILPEIEMPGHSQAAIAAYPWLGDAIKGASLEVGTGWGVSPHVLSVTGRVLDFYKDVLDEVFEIFPFEFVHLGADECPKTEWQGSDIAQEKIRALGLGGEDELQSWFLAQMTEFVHSRGRRAIGWDEILEGGLPAGAAVMSWRGEEGGVRAAELGHDVVMAPADQTYFDYYQADPAYEPLAHGTVVDLESVHRYRPVPDALSDTARGHVLGAQFQLWTEYMPTPHHVEYMAFPRACAFADVLWGAPAETDEFLRETLPAHVTRLDEMHVELRPLARVTADR